MPTYEYKCTVCNDRFEIEQSFFDDSLTVLDGCDTTDDGEHQLKKVFSSVGISFKGEGFYRNDARSAGNGSKSSNGSDSSSSSGSDSSSDSSSGSKDGSSASKEASTSSSSSSSSDSTPSKSTSSSSSSSD